MGFFDVFDFNGDGKLDFAEEAAKVIYLNSLLKGNEKDLSWYADDFAEDYDGYDIDFGEDGF